MQSKSYFNASSHGLPDPEVYRCMIDFMSQQISVTSEEFSAKANESVNKAKQAVASFISSPLEQIGFTSNTTAAFHSILNAIELSGRRVLITEHEWGDYYRLLSSRQDIDLQVLPSLDFSNPDLSSWAELIDEDVAAIFVPMITSIAGYRYPVEEIGVLKRPENTKLIIDAAQAVGQTGVDVTRLKADAIISTTRKWLRAPRQTAILWMNETWQKDNTPIRPSMLTPVDQNAALIVGIGKAVEITQNLTLHEIEKQLITKANNLRTWANTNGLDVYGEANSNSAIVSLTLPPTELDSIIKAFDAHEIIAKVIPCSNFEPLRALKEEKAQVLRLAPHLYNTDAEIEQLKAVISVAL